MKLKFLRALVGVVVPLLGPIVGLAACSALMSFYMKGMLFEVLMGALTIYLVFFFTKTTWQWFWAD